MRRTLTSALLCAILASAVGSAFGQPAPSAQTYVDSGFQHFYNLEFDQALEDFQTAAKLNPDSPDVYNHISQTILYREMLRSGSLETEMVTGRNPFLRREKLNPSAAEQKQFYDSIGRAMALANARIAANQNDAAAHYALGASFGLRSNYGFLVRKAYLDALRDATASRQEHKRVTDIDPTFIDAQFVQGVYDYLVGSLNWAWRMLGFVAGYHGDRERGIETLQMVAEKGRLNRSDAKVALCAIYRRERDPQKAIPLLKGLIQQYPRNYLFRMELVQMYGDAGDKDDGLAVINELDRLKRAGAPGFEYLPEEKIRYTRGTLLFWYNDLDQALEDMKAVTANADTLDLNTAVYAWLRLGQIYDLQGKRNAAIMAYNKTMNYAPHSDAADEAMKYVGRPYRR
jgi:tetratricopeptide (TPR) repeat protein